MQIKIIFQNAKEDDKYADFEYDGMGTYVKILTKGTWGDVGKCEKNHVV